MQWVEFNSFQIKRVFDGVICSPFFSQSSADVWIHSQLGAAVIHLVLAGPSEDFFFLKEMEEFNDKGPQFPHADPHGSSISRRLLKTSGPVTIFSRSLTNFVGSWSFLLPLDMLIILKLEHLDRILEVIHSFQEHHGLGLQGFNNSFHLGEFLEVFTH